MSSAQELQSLLRFLSQDAKVPLAQALGKVKDLQAARFATRKHVKAYKRVEQV
jgi:ubiquinone biosynthesis protein UbiJ